MRSDNSRVVALMKPKITFFFCVIPESEAPSGAKRVGNPDKVDIFLDTQRSRV
ncbi:MAG: hypothetical protein ABIE07_04520 [Candidatus Zixiibacteriota bacterium]